MTILKSINLIACSTAMLVGLSVTAGAETLRLSTLKQPGSAGALAAERFAELVEEKTEGDLTVTVYPGSQLGDWTEVYEQVIEGAVDMAMQPLATSSDKRLAITWFPYAFTDYDSARVALSPGGGVFQIIDESLTDQGLTPLAVYGAGMGGAGFASAVEEPGNTDLSRNLKVRVWPGGTTHKVLLEAFGYNVATMPWAELYTGLQTGVVDGQIGGTPTMTLESFSDITDTWVQYNDHFESDFFFINADRFSGLSDEHQAAVREAALEVATAQFAAVEAADAAALQVMRDNGTNVVTFDSPTLEALAATARAEVWPTIKDELGDEAYAILRASVGLE
ncbi:MAG: TRAP transporter substrate-binding protein DctP [Paracoccaceae bacterium]|nr:TRAP transporter substrate-binding protein DctP [Paracoccaceae bacterium]MDG2257589.1 TRAP transporter substrate-binding protein DctP [Paracoccaceae bacterium]